MNNNFSIGGRPKSVALGRDSIDSLAEDAAQKLAFISFFVFFAQDIFASIVTRLLGSDYQKICLNLLIGVPIVLYCIITGMRRCGFPIIMYSIVATIFVISFITHPEYLSWYQSEAWGIVERFFYLRRGIWAVLILCMVGDVRKIEKYLVWIALALLAFYLTQYAAAISRGYWVNLNSAGKYVNLDYNLEFGYDVLFPTAVFGAEFAYRNKKIFLPFFLVGALLIFLGGSRAPLIWVVAFFPVVFLFRWREWKNNPKAWLVIIGAAVIITFILFNGYERLVQSIARFFESLGFSSRTLTKMLDGSISDANGRDQIYAMALDLIRNSGAFGYGAYGDRYVIGRYFYWGYSHNLMLELLVTFGIIIGAAIILYLAYRIIKFAIQCNSRTWQVVFTIYLISNLRLMLSDSFWYNIFFWGLIALMYLWSGEHADRLENPERYLDDTIVYEDDTEKQEVVEV